MSDETKEQTAEAKLGEAEIGEHGLVLATAADVSALARIIVRSGMCPKAYQGKPADAMVAILAGQAVGFAPIQSLQNIAVINGRPSMYGDGPSSLAYGGGQVAWIKEWFEIEGEVVTPNYGSLDEYPNGLTACWQTQRKDTLEPSTIARFSVTDAKVAKLWGKKTKQGLDTPWRTYPKRMLTMRARAFGLRDNYGDALAGINQAEEWVDVQPTHEKHELSDAVGEPTITHEITSAEDEIASGGEGASDSGALSPATEPGERGGSPPPVAAADVPASPATEIPDPTTGELFDPADIAKDIEF